MQPTHKLRVFQLARENLRSIATIDAQFGDLQNQIRRAAISVISNISESCGCSTDPQRKRFIGIARASNKELQGQLLILSDLGGLPAEHALHQQVDAVGAMLYRLQEWLG